MHFGISTHLYHQQRLSREHLAQIAGYGFEAIELFATRSHFDYHDRAAIGQLGQWLKETGLKLHSIHAPITDRFGASGEGTSYSTASADNARRQVAVREAEAALGIAREIPTKFMVVHLGVPGARAASGDNSRAAASRSAEEICTLADPLGVRLALEVIPNDLSSAQAVVTMLDRDFEGTSVGLCMDFGHAHLMGDLGEAIETLSGHMWTTHVHDNGRKHDDNLAPYLGTIDWDVAMMETQKIGYDGVLMFEVSDTGDPVDVLRRCVKARERLEKTLVTF